MPSSAILDTGDPRWGRFVAAHPHALPYHHPSWAATLAACYGFRPFVVAIVGAGGEIEAGLPVMEVAHRPRGRARWVALPFTDRCPALAADAAAERALAEALPAAAAAARVGTVQVRAPLPGLLSAPVAVQHVLDLAPRPDAIERGFSSAARRGVRKARREGVEIRVGAAEDDLARVYYALHLQTRRRLGVPVQPRRFFRLLWQRVLAPGHGRLLLACAEGAPIAGAVFLEAGPTVIYKYGASDAAAWGRRPNNLLFGEVIRWACEAGLRELDFGRTDLEHEGLKQFKRGWGAQELPLHHTYSGMETPSGDGSGVQRLLAPVIRHSPLGVGRLVGAAYRHFG